MKDPARKRPAHLELLAISWNFGWPIAAGVVLGHWLDERFGSSPAATLLFGIGALAVSVRRMIELGREDVAERRQEREEEREEDRP
jgi:F0F1-type ATP synthase assembly protein I